MIRGSPPTNPAALGAPWFKGVFARRGQMAEREGLRRPFSPTTPITSIEQRGSAGYDYIVDYRSDQHRRIARSPTSVNSLRAGPPCTFAS